MYGFHLRSWNTRYLVHMETHTHRPIHTDAHTYKHAHEWVLKYWQTYGHVAHLAELVKIHKQDTRYINTHFALYIT